MRRLPLLLVALLTGCSSGDTPTGPTPRPYPGTRPPAVPTEPVNAPRFDDQLWGDLVYAEFGREENSLSGPMPYGSQVLDHVRNYSIDPTDMPAELVTFIIGEIPELWRELTGETYTGRVVVTSTPQREDRWTTVQMEPLKERTCGSLGHAGVGQRHRPSTLYLSVDCSHPRSTFAHEFGHDLDFSHSRHHNDLMYPVGPTNVAAFSASELYHARLAYRVGPGAEYCGELFTPGCP